MRIPRTIRIKNHYKLHPVLGLFGFTFGLILSVLLSPILLPFYMVSDMNKKHRR